MATKDQLKALLDAPIPMARNTYMHFYNGGKLRAEFVGDPEPKDDFYSEEWFFSTNRAITPGRDNPPDKGFSKIKLPSGEIINIVELLEALPEQTLGQAHAAKYGPSLGILVKIFDVGEGAHIPVHWHPSPQFARQNMNSPFGKNEAWYMVNTRPGARTWIGWKENIDPADFRRWMAAQDVAEMRKHMHIYDPKPGDFLFLRDSIVHSLGEGCCVLEPQEPSDWNILAEWEGYPYGKEDAHCGVGWDKALEAADFARMDPDYLTNYCQRTGRVVRGDDGNQELEYLPEEARKYFWLSQLKVATELAAPQRANWYGMIGTQGEAVLKGSWGEVAIRRGLGVLIPACIDAVTVVNRGGKPFEAVCCYPPATEG